MTTHYQGRIGRRIVTITGEGPPPDVPWLYAIVRRAVWPGHPATYAGYTVSVQRAVRGPRP